jgi:hypothetical protein
MLHTKHKRQKSAKPRLSLFSGGLVSPADEFFEAKERAGDEKLRGKQPGAELTEPHSGLSRAQKTASHSIKNFDPSELQQQGPIKAEHLRAPSQMLSVSSQHTRTTKPVFEQTEVKLGESDAESEKRRKGSSLVRMKEQSFFERQNRLNNLHEQVNQYILDADKTNQGFKSEYFKKESRPDPAKKLQK